MTLLNHIVIVVVLVFFNYHLSFGQCTVETGPDIAVCWEFQSDPDSIWLSSSVTGGQPPYQYIWEARYETFFGILSSSFFLSDTTISSPALVEATDDTLVLVLRVIDSNGSQCSDSLIITYSEWSVLAVETVYNINQGDTLLLIPDCWEPNHPYSIDQPFVSYEWTPSYNIADTTATIPIVWPDTSMTYKARVIDQFGCTKEVGCSARVNVITTSTTEPSDINQLNINVFPNPSRGQIIIRQESHNNEILHGDVFTSIGQHISSFEVTSQQHSLVLPNSQSFYLLRLKTNKAQAWYKIFMISS
jgi:hypothetical protein